MTRTYKDITHEDKCIMRYDIIQTVVTHRGANPTRETFAVREARSTAKVVEYIIEPHDLKYLILAYFH